MNPREPKAQSARTKGMALTKKEKEVIEALRKEAEADKETLPPPPEEVTLPKEDEPAVPRYEPHFLPRFELGIVVSTPAVVRYLSKHGQSILPYLGMHVRGDWGIITEKDKEANETAVAQGFRIFSVYKINGEKIWIVTEADRSKTTILFPEEYSTT